jgi:hypothetical protein
MIGLDNVRNALFISVMDWAENICREDADG